MSLTVGKGWPT